MALKSERHEERKGNQLPQKVKTNTLNKYPESITDRDYRKKGKKEIARGRGKSTAWWTIDVLSDKWHNSIGNNISILLSCHH